VTLVARARAGFSPLALTAVRMAYDPLAPAKLIEPTWSRWRVWGSLLRGRADDLESSVDVLGERIGRLFPLAASMEVEAFAARGALPVGSRVRVVNSM